MDSIDRLIRALYAIAQEEEWTRCRALVQAQVCKQLGFPVSAWLTFVAERPGRGEFTLWPVDAPVASARMLALPFSEADEFPLQGEHALPGTPRGLALRYRHYDSRLTSVVGFGFKAGARPPPAEAIRQVTTHMVEAAALALRQFIQRDERLSRMGRSSRGGAAMVDPGGTIYTASRDFRDLLSQEFGEGVDSCLPFALPDEALGERGAFTHGGLHFRATRMTDHHYQLHMRKAQPLDGLSPREQEIARALGAGRTFKTVARQCGIAVSTVANHASRIYRKLGVYRREDLVEMIRAAGRKVTAQKQKEAP